VRRGKEPRALRSQEKAYQGEERRRVEHLPDSLSPARSTPFSTPRKSVMRGESRSEGLPGRSVICASKEKTHRGSGLWSPRKDRGVQKTRGSSCRKTKRGSAACEPCPAGSAGEVWGTTILLFLGVRL